MAQEKFITSFYELNEEDNKHLLLTNENRELDDQNFTSFSLVKSELNSLEFSISGDNMTLQLADNMLVVPIEYKIIHKNNENAYVKCMQILYNGNVQLYYLTKDYKSFLEAIPSLKIENIKSIVGNVLVILKRISNFGFLNCGNVDLSLEHLFISKSNDVYIVYIPISPPAYDFDVSIQILRDELAKIMSKDSRFSQDTIAGEFISLLCDKQILFDDLFIKLNSSTTSELSTINADLEMNEGYNELNIISINSPYSLQFKINRNEFVLGRSEEKADGCIQNNRLVGRRHCKIMFIDNKYGVIDLNSTNGTFLNNKRLSSGCWTPINDGDILRLANLEFVIRLG